MGTLNPWSIRRVNLYDFTWLVYIIDSLDRNIKVWHESITLQILPDRNIEVQYIKYTSEYIPKLQIHPLLTRKVFSQHNLSAQVFFSVSSGSSMSSCHLHLQVIFIFKLSSSSIHLHLDLDHHSIWIITAGSSLNLDHHWVIITGAISWFFSS